MHGGNLPFYLPSSGEGRGQDQWICKLAVIQHFVQGQFSRVDARGLGPQNEPLVFLEQCVHHTHKTLKGGREPDTDCYK